MYQNYRELNKSHLEEADQELNKPYDPKESFGVFVKRVEDIMDVVEAAKAPYNKSQIVLRAFTNIKKADRYQDRVREWRKKPQIEKSRVILRFISLVKQKISRKIVELRSHLGIMALIPQTKPY